MKQLAVIVVLVLGGLLAWLFATRLSSDALGMGVGFLFGILAGIPAALLVLASTDRRRQREDDKPAAPQYRREPHQQQFPVYPTVIVVNGTTPPAPPTSASSQQLTAKPDVSGRRFAIVGEKEVWNSDSYSDSW